MARFPTNFLRLGLLLSAVILLVFAVEWGMVKTYANSTVPGSDTLRVSPQGEPQFTLGEDELICLGLRATIAGTMEADLLTGTSGPDVIAGRGGDDIIDGMGGDDTLCGGSGDDFILGGPGDDFIRAWSGDDFVNAGPGRDLVLGDEGDDELLGGPDRDFLSGSSGNDILYSEGYTLDDKAQVLYPPPDVILGGEGDDVIIGGAGDDGILAFGGNDFIVSGAGEDLIGGGSGDDYMDGGPGTQDDCRGDLGADSAVNCEIRTGIERQDARRFPFVR